MDGSVTSSEWLGEALSSPKVKLKADKKALKEKEKLEKQEQRAKKRELKEREKQALKEQRAKDKELKEKEKQLIKEQIEKEKQELKEQKRKEKEDQQVSRCQWVDAPCPYKDSGDGYCKTHSKKIFSLECEKKGIKQCSYRNCKNVLPDNKYKRCLDCREKGKITDKKRNEKKSHANAQIKEKREKDKENGIDDLYIKQVDKVVSRFELNYYKHYFIKMKLATFLKGNKHEVNKMRKFINDVVDNQNMIVFHAWHLLNLHFIRLLEYNLPLEDKINQTFIYQICCAVTTLDGKRTPPKNPSLLETWKLYMSSIPSNYALPCRDKQCNLLSNLSVMMITNIKNHLNLNWESHLFKYLKNSHPNNNNSIIGYIKRRILGQVPDPKHPSKYDNNPENEKIIEFYRTKYKHPNMDFDIFKNHIIFIPHLYEMMKLSDILGQKKFSLFPRKSRMIPQHIHICNTSFLHLVSIYTGIPVDKKNKNPEAEWSKYFRMELVQTKNRKFAYITTNGYDVSIALKVSNGKKLPYTTAFQVSDLIKAAIINIGKFRKTIRHDIDVEDEDIDTIPENMNDDKEIITNWNEYSNHLGLDPGKRSLFTTCDDNNKFVKCTREEFHHLTGLTKYRRKRVNNARKPENKKIQEILSQNSFRVIKVADYIRSLSAVMNIVRDIQKEYKRDFYRKYKFLLYTKRPKAYKVVSDKLLKGTNGKIVIGYGTGTCNGKGIKGATIPVKGFYDYLLTRKDRFKVIKINESYTTKMCSNCESENGGVYKPRKESVKRERIYALCRCKNEMCHITWNRDINASRNIHYLLKTEYTGKERPPYLCPKKVIKKVKNTIVLNQSIDWETAILQDQPIKHGNTVY
jgi:hypothetical protein